MLTHQGIWAAIDALAARSGLSPSGLARKGGLDPTTFNKSKRLSQVGKPRWPSTESLAKILTATGCSFEHFLIDMAGAEEKTSTQIPFLEARHGTFAHHFTPDGKPTGPAWSHWTPPCLHLPGLFALEMTGAGILLAVPCNDFSSAGRFLVQQKDGDPCAGEVQEDGDGPYRLTPLSPDNPTLRISAEDILWRAKIILLIIP